VLKLLQQNAAQMCYRRLHNDCSAGRNAVSTVQELRLLATE